MGRTCPQMRESANLAAMGLQTRAVTTFQTLRMRCESSSSPRPSLELMEPLEDGRWYAALLRTAPGVLCYHTARSFRWPDGHGRGGLQLDLNRLPQVTKAQRV